MKAAPISIGLAIFCLLASVVYAADCIDIKSPAIDPATGECVVFENTCDVPLGWSIVAVCPEEALQAFQASQLLSLGGLLVAVFILVMLALFGIRKFAASKEKTEKELPPEEGHDTISSKLSAKLSTIKETMSSSSKARNAKSSFKDMAHSMVPEGKSPAPIQVQQAEEQPAEKKPEPLEKLDRKRKYKDALKQLEELEKKK